MRYVLSRRWRDGLAAHDAPADAGHAPVDAPAAAHVQAADPASTCLAAATRPAAACLTAGSMGGEHSSSLCARAPCLTSWLCLAPPPSPSGAGQRPGRPGSEGLGPTRSHGCASPLRHTASQRDGSGTTRASGRPRGIRRPLDTAGALRKRNRKKAKAATQRPSGKAPSFVSSLALNLHHSSRRTSALGLTASPPRPPSPAEVSRPTPQAGSLVPSVPSSPRQTRRGCPARPPARFLVSQHVVDALLPPPRHHDPARLQPLRLPRRLPRRPIHARRHGPEPARCSAGRVRRRRREAGGDGARRRAPPSKSSRAVVVVDDDGRQIVCVGRPPDACLAHVRVLPAAGPAVFARGRVAAHRPPRAGAEPALVDVVVPVRFRRSSWDHPPCPGCCRLDVLRGFSQLLHRLLLLVFPVPLGRHRRRRTSTPPAQA